MKVLRAGNYKRMPWKNGKGETVEIAVFPPGASVGDFDWRISMATVADDGPFSVFEGIDRTLSVLSGEGLELFVSGQQPILLRQDTAPHAFAADIATSARLLKDTVTDLNVMTRRGRFIHNVSRLSIEGRTDIVARHAVTMVLATGRCRCAAEELSDRDVVLLEQGETCTFEVLDSAQTLLVIGIEPDKAVSEKT